MKYLEDGTRVFVSISAGNAAAHTASSRLDLRVYSIQLKFLSGNAKEINSCWNLLPCSALVDLSPASTSHSSNS